MRRWISTTALFAVLALWALATSAAADDQRPPPAVITEALEICTAVVFDGADFDAATQRSGWVEVAPKATGSSLATRAWRALSLRETYVMELPNGGCSFAMIRGDGAALHTAFREALNARMTFTLVSTKEVRGGGAVRYAYCAAGEPPVLASAIAAKKSGETFVANLFRASQPRSDTCTQMAKGTP